MAAPIDTVGDFTNAPALTTPVAAPYRADADLYDARFLILYNALNVAVVGLDAASILNGIITAPLIETQPTWSTVALVGTTWTPANLSYYQDSLGIVHIRPEDLSGTADLADGTTITTLPAGSRPGTKQFFPCNAAAAGGAGSCVLSIDTNGVVKIDGTGGTSQPLTRSIRPGGIAFRAEN